MINVFYENKLYLMINNINYFNEGTSGIKNDIII